MKRLLVLTAILSLPVVAPSKLQAQNLLTDGGFENAATVPGWDLAESVFDQSTMMDRSLGDINTASQIGFDPHSGNLDLWLRAFVGGGTAGPDNLTNAALSQTVSAMAGEEYTFSGHSRFEFNYSGGEDTLDEDSPLGAVPSPTTTTMRLEFLNASGAVIGAPVVLDVKQDRIAQVGFPDANDNSWYEHVLVGTAPAGTAQARVTAEARKMVRNTGGTESAFYDDFSLLATSAPAAELLMNALLEEEATDFNDAWVITQVPGGNIPADPTVSTADFASRPDGVGQLGVWLRSFTGNTAQPADAILEQTVPGVPGGEYTLSGWSNFQTNYSGGAAGFPTQTLFQMEFLNASNGVIGSTLTLDLKADGQTNGAGWREHTLSGTAPAGTESVRVRAAALDMVTNPAGGQQSAFFDDLALTVESGPADDADFDDDGDVDGADFLVWQRNLGTTSGAMNDDGDADGDGAVNADDLAVWRGNFGSGAAVAAAGAIPEPASAALATLALAGLAKAGRRRSSRNN